MRLSKFFAPFLFLLTASALAADRPITSTTASSGNEVIILYNKKVPASKEVATYYAGKRKVPEEQIFGFDLTSEERMGRAEFRDDLQKPLAKLLTSRNLWKIGSETIPASSNQPSRMMWRVKESKIRYAVLCYGMPLGINPDPTLKEPGMEKLRPELRRDEASVDSELAVLPLIENRPALFAPLQNALYGATNVPWLHPTNGLLLVSRLDGPDPEIAKRLVDKAMEAETNGLWGRAYFDIRSITDPGFKQGDDWISNAAELAKQLGFETYIDKGPGTIPAGFPMSQIAYYLGWYAADATGPFAQPTVEFMPGAFAYHLHSHSAFTIRSTNKAWVGPLLSKGVTATMGTVFEPYLAGTPDVAVFTSRLIYFGMTLGEAAWAAQPVLSWQTTVVGDPLYRPFGQNPELLHDKLMREESPLLNWSYVRLANLNLAIGKRLDEVVAFMEALNPLAKSAVLAEKMGDLYNAQGKPSSSAHAYEAALSLDPTPQQRIRLRLALGEKLVSLGEREKAAQNYKQLLAEAPDYPEKQAVVARMEQLAGSKSSTTNSAAAP